MISRKCLLAVLLCMLSLATAQARNVFVLPTSPGSSQPITVLSADPFASAGTISGLTQNVHTVLGLPNGSKYYLISRAASDSIVAVDGTSLAIGARRDVSGLQNAALTPDGSRLLVAAGQLLVYNAATDTLVANVDVGGGAVDVAVSLDGRRAFVLSTSSLYGGGRLIAVDLATNTALSTQVEISSGGSYSPQVSVAPNGLVYVATLNLIHEIDGRTMTERARIGVAGNIGKLIYTPDGRYGIAVNQNPLQGDSALVQVDLQARTLAARVPNGGFNVTLSKVVYGGRNQGGQERVYAYTSSGATIYEIPLPASTIPTGPASFVTAYGLAPVSGMSVSGEVTTPRYLFVSSGNTVYRIDLLLGSGIPSGTQTVGTPTRDVVYAGGGTAGAASNMLVYNSNQTVAPGGTALPVIVRVLDSAGRPVPNATVAFASSSLTFDVSSTTTNADGYAATTPNVPISVGTYSLTITTAAGTSTATLNVSTTGGGGTPGTGGLSIVSGNGQVTPGNFPFANPFVVVVRDTAGAPVSNVTVSFSLTAGQGTLVQNTQDSSGSNAVCSGNICNVVTNSEGRASVNMIASFLATPGQNYIQSTIAATYGTQTVTFYATALRPALGSDPGATLLINLTPDDRNFTGRAGETRTAALQARIFAGGSGGATQPLPNVALSVSTGNDPALGPTASCSGGVALSDINGIATCDLVFGPKVGNSPMTINAAGNLFQGSISVTAGPPARFEIQSGNNQSGNPGQTLPLAFRAQIVDAGGNPLSGTRVTWEVSTANAVTLSNVITTANQNGQVSALGTLGGIAGTHQVRVRTVEGGVVGTFNVTVNIPVGGVAIVSGNNQSATQNTAFAQPLTVRVTNTSGQAISGVAVTFAVASGSATVSPTSVNTDANGQASANVTAGPNTGAVVVTASTGGHSVSFNLTVRLPGPVFGLNDLKNAAGFQVQGRVSPGQLLTITGTGLAPGISGVVLPPSPVGAYPYSLAGVEVVIGGALAPILHVANVNGQEQVTVQVPFEIAQSGTVNIMIRVQGGSTTLENVPVVPLAPGIFETVTGGNRHAVVMRPDGSFASSTNFLRRGELGRAFVVGLGQVAPATATNYGGIGGQTVNAQIIVGVNNAGVRVISSEYVEGTIGLYLVTFEVPADAPTGAQIPFSIGAVGPDGQTVYYSNTTVVPIQ